MTGMTKRITVAAVVAVVAIAGSVAAIALSDDNNDNDDRDRPLAALAEELDDEFEVGELLEGFIERLIGDEDFAEIPEGVLGLLDTLLGDLISPRGDEPRGPEAAPRSEHDGKKAPGDKPKKDKAPKDRPKRNKAPEGPDRGFPFGGEPFGDFDFRFEQDGEFPFGFPFFGDSPLGDFLEDGRISPEEARQLERFFRDGFAGDVFRFDIVPPGTDRPPPFLPDGLLEGLDAIPFREFFADGEVTPREREALRQALDEWLNGLLERFDAANG